MTPQKMGNNLQKNLFAGEDGEERDGFTCKHFSVESLNPVIPHAETDHGLQPIECPHPDLGEKVVGELQLFQGSLTSELVSTKTSQRIPELKVLEGARCEMLVSPHLEKLMLASCV